MSGQKAKSEALRARIARAATLAYLHGRKDSEICAELGIATSTLANWKTRPEWSVAIKALSGRAWGEALHLLQASTTRAVAALIEMLEDDDPRIRLRAAALILGSGLPASV
ncbi:hypothetical protein [Qipengyuania sp. RANM35]|uniref:terminase gpP N-terminus-related DNA-binding protein n=1 Tax=Qipengyuania sp. RANM35 TaxID=3068635 RepID=UPI0034DB2918